MNLKSAHTWHYQTALENYENLLAVAAMNKNVIILSMPVEIFWEK